MAVHSYLRVSTSDRGQTVENQRLAIQNGTNYKTDFWYADEGVSGSVPAKQRPAFASMLAAVKKGDICIVTALDRLGRDAEDILNTVNTFEKMGVGVCILALGNTDITSVMGKAFVIMLSALAEMERNAIKERTLHAMARVKADGIFVGRPPVIDPVLLVDMVEAQKAGLSLEEMSGKFGHNKMTISRNLKKWSSRLQEYADEFMKRQIQYTARKLLAV